MEIKNIIEKIEIDINYEDENENIPILIGMITGGFISMLFLFIISKNLDNPLLLTLIIILGPILCFITSIAIGILFKNLYLKNKN